jgi:hypothetical protein
MLRTPRLIVQAWRTGDFPEGPDLSAVWSAASLRKGDREGMVYECYWRNIEQLLAGGKGTGLSASQN